MKHSKVEKSIISDPSCSDFEGDHSPDKKVKGINVTYGELFAESGDDHSLDNGEKKLISIA